MSARKTDTPDDLVAQLLGNYQKPDDLISENGLLKQLTKFLGEKAQDAAMAHCLGHGKREAVSNAAGDICNGKSKKAFKREFDELPIEVTRG